MAGDITVAMRRDNLASSLEGTRRGTSEIAIGGKTKLQGNIPRVVKVTKIGCELFEEDYGTTRVIYEDGRTGVDCTAECDSCPYETEREVWRQRGDPEKADPRV